MGAEVHPRRLRLYCPHPRRTAWLVDGDALLELGDRLSPCPCCGCPDVYVADTDEGGKTVACPRCGMSGPESVDGDAKEAKNAWEYLHGKMCRKCSRHLLKRIRELKAEVEALKRGAPPG